LNLTSTSPFACCLYARLYGLEKSQLLSKTFLFDRDTFFCCEERVLSLKIYGGLRISAGTQVLGLDPMGVGLICAENVKEVSGNVYCLY
jgi:hypothetical protein